MLSESPRNKTYDKLFIGWLCLVVVAELCLMMWNFLMRWWINRADIPPVPAIPPEQATNRFLRHPNGHFLWQRHPYR